MSTGIRRRGEEESLARRGGGQRRSEERRKGARALSKTREDGFEDGDKVLGLQRNTNLIFVNSQVANQKRRLSGPRDPPRSHVLRHRPYLKEQTLGKEKNEGGCTSAPSLLKKADQPTRVLLPVVTTHTYLHDTTDSPYSG